MCIRDRAGPPLILPTIAKAKSKKYFPPPAVSNKAPKSTNKNIKSTETPIGILILLEATRRAIGLPLVIIAICFLLFSYFGKYAPDIISHGGLSVKRLVGFQWFDQEAIFGIPIGVSVDFIFLFVLFGALLETA